MKGLATASQAPRWGLLAGDGEHRESGRSANLPTSPLLRLRRSRLLLVSTRKCGTGGSGWEGCLPQHDGSVRIETVSHNQPATLDRLLAQPQGYAEFAMRNIVHVPPALLAESPTGFFS